MSFDFGFLNELNNYKFDIVMQGPLHPYTYEIALKYINFPFVNSVIISSWKNHEEMTFLDHHPKIKYVFSEDVVTQGDNRNRQIVSTVAGLKKCTSKFAMKTRTDQFIYLDSLQILFEFFMQYSEPRMHFIDNSKKPNNRICVAGMHKTFPYCPRDHFMMGNVEDLLDFWDIPLDFSLQFTPERKKQYEIDQITYKEDWEYNIRVEVYLGTSYLSKFDERVKLHLSDFQKYLVDLAPNREEAMEVTKEIATKILKPFPRNGIDFHWYSHREKNYFYDFQSNVGGQFWAEDTSEWNKD